jgi:hypothetical protein
VWLTRLMRAAENKLAGATGLVMYVTATGIVTYSRLVGRRIDPTIGNIRVWQPRQPSQWRIRNYVLFNLAAWLLWNGGGYDSAACAMWRNGGLGSLACGQPQ